MLANKSRTDRNSTHFRNAQRIAFAPLTFQAARVACDNGLLQAVEDAGTTGLTPAHAAEQASIPVYAARVLLEACLSVDLVELDEGLYRISPSGRLLLHHDITRVNMNFTHDVCYQGAFFLEESLEKGAAAGLQVFGPWSTIYEGLSALPPQAQKSWFEFDHFYSNNAFPAALPIVFRQPIGRLLDVGGNTGKWAIACARHDSNVRVTILDHAAQLKKAHANAEQAGVAERIAGEPMDLLDHARPFPGTYDAVWMSQFLDCFGEDDIVQLLRRGRAALAPEGKLYVLETYWDRQPNDAARDAVIATSLYFTCMANGNSRMYHSDDLRHCVTAAGLAVVEEHQLNYHTLFVCR